MSTNNEITSPVAVLNLPELNKPLLTYSRAVHDALRRRPEAPHPSHQPPRRPLASAPSARINPATPPPPDVSFAAALALSDKLLRAPNRDVRPPRNTGVFLGRAP